VASALAQFFALEHQVLASEDLREHEFAFSRQAMGIFLHRKPHGSLKDRVEEDVVLPQELIDARFWIAPKLLVALRIVSVLLQGDSRKRDGSDEGVGPHVKGLARDLGIILGNRYAPTDV